MAGPDNARRSGRARKAVNTYAEEQAEHQYGESITETIAPMERWEPAAKRRKIRSRNVIRVEASASDHVDADEQELPREESKQAESQMDGEAAIGLTADNEPPHGDEEFKPAPKKAKAGKKKVAPIGKLDSEGVMRLDTTEQRPKGEKKPPRVYEVPAKSKSTKGKSVNLAAILAESFEDRWERKISKIKRLAPGAPEVRLKDNVPFMTDSYKTFLHRASTQRMFVLSRTQGVEENCHANHEDCPVHQIKIAGTTGNVYTVIISHMPTCSCPNTNFKRHDSGDALCKHILYVLHFVLKAPQHLCYQNALLTSELKEITANAPSLPTAIIELMEARDGDGNRKPVEDDCPICCMEFGKDDKVTWCRAACGNNIHQECFDLWAQTKPKDNVTCPYCRTLWQEPKSAKPGQQSETVTDVKMTQRTGGYFNVRDQLAYD